MKDNEQAKDTAQMEKEPTLTPEIVKEWLERKGEGIFSNMWRETEARDPAIRKQYSELFEWEGETANDKE